jgi:hypothetical protein
MLGIKRRGFVAALAHAAKLDSGKGVSTRAPALEDELSLSTLPRNMSWLDKMEKRAGWIAIPGLLRYVAGFTALVFILYKWDAHFLDTLSLDKGLVLQGQIWRLITYIFVPQIGGGFLVYRTPDWFNAAFSVFFLIWAGDRLEEVWGAFKLTLYFLIGMMGTTVAAFFLGAQFSNSMLIASIFFAFARFFPNVVIFLFYILPLKVKWIAWAYAAILLLQFLGGPMQLRGALVAVFANYLLFFGPELFLEAKQRQESSSRRRRFESESRSDAEPLHKCATCGATELTDQSLEFRVARNGEEYCVPHLPV